MVGVPARMRTLRGKLALIRNGFGAAVLPAQVQRLQLQLAFKINNGHMGPRKFWRLYLPRLQYHNPALEVQVVREHVVGGPATLTVEFANGKKEVIDCQHKHENAIVNALYELTKAKPLPINDKDSRLAQEFLKAKSDAVKKEEAKESRRAAKREEARLGLGPGSGKP